MAKALKVVGIVVGVVAIVASAGALLAPAAAATATTAATAGGFLGMSAATLASIGTIASLVGAGLGAATTLLTPKPSFSNGGNPLSFQTNPQSGLPYAIGRTRMSGLRIHADTYDGLSYKSEGKDDILAFAVMLSAGGEIEEIESFRADKEVITFNPTTGMGTGSWTDWMAQKVSLGLSGVSALALAFGGAFTPGWGPNHQLSGITHALWSLRGDPKGNHYGAGVPEPEWIGKWVKVYDPRLDSTYPGGSGSHRALDESTYEYSANPYLHALTWALGRWQNGKRTLGIGAPVANIRVADFVEGANVADANDWRCGGVEWSTDPKWTTLKRMLQAGGGEPTMTGAMIGCRVNTPRVSIATVTGDDLLDSASFPMTRSRRDRFNSVIPRFRSEDHDWEVISGTPVTVSAYVSEDGGLRTKEIDFPLVQSETSGDGLAQAGQLAAYEIVNSREAGPWRFTVGPKFVGIKTGDVITLDMPDEGIDTQPVLVRSRSIDPASFKITFEVETETDAKHDFALGKTTTPPPSYTPSPPDLTPPTPSDTLWSVNSVIVENSPAIVVAGACEFSGADAVLIEYRKVGETDWQTMPKSEASVPVNLVIGPLDGGTEYEVRLAYQSGSRVGGWLTLDPVTTPFPFSSISGQLTNPAHTLPADEDGTVLSFAGAGGTFLVRRYGALVTTGTAFSVLSESGVDVSIDAGTGAYVVNSMSADGGTATFRAVYDGMTIDQVYSISKARQGLASKIIQTYATRLQINYDANGAPDPSVQNNAFIAEKTNTTATVNWSVFDLNGSARTPTTTYLSGATGDTVTQTLAQFAAAQNGTGGVIVKATATDGAVTMNDSVSVIRVSQGAAAVGFVQDSPTPSAQFINQTWYRPTSKEWYRASATGTGGWVRILGDLSALDSVDTAHIDPNAITQTLSMTSALTATLGGALGYPEMLCIGKVTITTDGGQVHVLSEFVNDLTTAPVSVADESEYAARICLTRGPSSATLNTIAAGGSATLYSAYSVVSGVTDIIAPYRTNINRTTGFEDYSILWGVSQTLGLDAVDSPTAGSYTYGIWLGAGEDYTSASTRYRQFLKLLEVKR